MNQPTALTRRTVLITASLLVLLTIGIIFVFQKRPVANPTFDFYSSVQPSPSTDQEDSARQTYHNEKYKYRFEYPADLHIPSISTPENVSFLESSDLGLLNITTKHTAFRTVDEWFAATNKAMHDTYVAKQYPPEAISQLRLDKRITVAGYPALVTHSYSPGGDDFWYEITITFIKKDKLFQIGTRSYTPEQIQQYFHFDEKTGS